MPDLHMVFEKLGEINGSVREMKHAANNLTMKVDAVDQKVDGLAQAVIKQGEHGVHIADLQEHRRSHHERILILEVERHKREGAIGLVEWIARHWPFVGLSGILIVWIGIANKMLPL